MNLSLEHSTKKRDVRPARRATGVRSAEQRAFPRFRGAGALLATAMLLLAMAPFQHAANAGSSRQWNAQWAHISSTLVASLGATDETTARVQGEQLLRWMQSRAASFGNPQTLSAVQVAALLDEWTQTQRGQIVVKQLAPTSQTRQSSTRLYASSFALPLSNAQNVSLPMKSQRLSQFSLSSHAAAKLSGVRTNRSHE
ncbi:MAG TPA: hypothetical protein VM821_07335 [Abditibacteriaceae bacterium]|nr:hypothetical protein [Abditibacteriaceae bacterium]